jgi:hypothetical protein
LLTQLSDEPLSDEGLENKSDVLSLFFWLESYGAIVFRRSLSIDSKMNNPTAASCGVSKRGRIASVAWL